MEINYDELDLGEGQEICPICNEVISPGAMQFCQHYLWTRWDGEVIWEIQSASHLVEVASELWDQLCDLENEDDLQGTLDEVERQFKKIIAVARDASSAHPQDFIPTEHLQAGTMRQTEGMVSGGGYSEFTKKSAEEWANIRTDQLKHLGALIRAARCST